MFLILSRVCKISVNVLLTTDKNYLKLRFEQRESCQCHKFTTNLGF